MVEIVEHRTNTGRFVSLRWRVLLPVMLVIAAVAALGAYVLAENLGVGLEATQTQQLLDATQATAGRAGQLYERHLREAGRVAFTVGVGEALGAGDSEALQPIAENLAIAADLDSIILVDRAGTEVLGLQRIRLGGTSSFAVSTRTDLSAEAIVAATISGESQGAAALLRTSEGVTLYTAVPVTFAGRMVGAALVGQRLSAVLADLRGSGLAELALYGPGGDLLQTTFTLRGARAAELALDPGIYTQTLRAERQIPLQSLAIEAEIYQGAYQALRYGPQTLGVLGVLLPDNLPLATQAGRESTGLLVAGLAAGIVLTLFVPLTMALGRLRRVEQTARALATGHVGARSRLAATDEIGRVAQALDQYAAATREREDHLQALMRRQRRESAFLLGIIEALPDGIVIQDLDGRVWLMNEHAKELLGSQCVFRSANLHELTAVVTDVLGAALAPGVYALGDPQRIDLDGKMLSAQAAAILSLAQQRVGTVIVLRDITATVRREQAQDDLLRRIEAEVQEPLSGLAHGRARQAGDPAREFARRIARHTATLQKLIVEMRELTDMNLRDLRAGQHALDLETLIWDTANDWRQVAAAAGLGLDVIIERKKLHVLGDERRLRWAIGNIVDNAIKYTLPGGKLSLEIRNLPTDRDDRAYLRVRDSGVGILEDELPQVFTRFFRGTPTTAGGQVIRVPGTGQGLAVAQQILEAHGGQLRIKSVPGTGTEVSFSLPLTAAESMTLPELPDADGETVRLADDDGETSESHYGLFQ